MSLSPARVGAGGCWVECLVTAGHFPSWPCPWPQTHMIWKYPLPPLPWPHGPMTSLPTSPFQGVGGGGCQGGCHGPVSWAGSLGKGVVCQSCTHLPPWPPVPSGILPRIVPSRHKPGFVSRDKELALTSSPVRETCQPWPSHGLRCCHFPRRGD